MIAHLSGKVVQVGLTRAIVDVGGLGYAVELTAAHAASLAQGEVISMHTSLLVRETSFTVYGFASTDERTVFEHLLTVTGVGTRHAMAALSTLDIDELTSAVGADDDRPFRTVPGIGPKTARLIVMTLQGKVGATSDPSAPTALPSEPAQDSRPPAPAPRERAPGPTGRGLQRAHALDGGRSDAPARAEAIAGLVSLGWTRKTAQDVVESLFVTDPRGAEQMSTAALIRAALARLAR